MMETAIECIRKTQSGVLNIGKRRAHHQSIKLMGCHFVLTAISKDVHKAWVGIRAGVAEIQRIERLISSWKLSSETSQININAGVRPVKVNKELFDLIDRSLKVSHLTSGAFDISGSLAREYWSFQRKEAPWLDSNKIDELKNLIDYRNIELNREASTVYLKSKGMKIGFGAIGKGYAAMRASKVMKRVGLRSGLVNASGDLMCWGEPLQKDLWEINIPDPEDRGRNLLQLDIPQGSAVTSGNYENYTIHNGKRYAHIIDPRTGLPTHGIKSVTILCPNPEFGDAIATAITVMGVEEGLAVVNKLNGVECLIIDDKNIQHYSNTLKP